MEHPRTTWPLLWLAVLAGIGMVVTSFGASLDGNNCIRVGFTAALIALAGVRCGIAFIRREQGKAWILYAAMLVLGPIVWMAAEAMFCRR